MAEAESQTTEDNIPSLEDAVKAVASEIDDCINAGGNWDYVEDALTAFAYSIMNRCGVVLK